MHTSARMPAPHRRLHNLVQALSWNSKKAALRPFKGVAWSSPNAALVYLYLIIPGSTIVQNIIEKQGDFRVRRGACYNDQD